jgi:hypothetical protein
LIGCREKQSRQQHENNLKTCVGGRTFACTTKRGLAPKHRVTEGQCQGERRVGGGQPKDKALETTHTRRYRRSLLSHETKNMIMGENKVQNYPRMTVLPNCDSVHP